MKTKFLVPLALFVLLAAFLAIGLHLKPGELPSPLIGKPAPAFKLPQLHADDKTLALEEMRGQVWLLNVWASWCVTCREEQPVLMDFAQRKLVPIVGLNYKDQNADALAWLKQFGDPYAVSIVDAQGQVGIDYGVYGVPETFLIDKRGVIRYKQTGAVTPTVLQDTLIPKIEELKRES